ncbi:probable ATP-dependent RNA helicase ddx42 isoform X2 [Neodiprion fabricii]|uniref:probable ATP-dependent RNA helicase ddx42 isoform X2 n=1 Tax=Neodiprion fabricii TaxID=2872261 RepID=UPI001ED9641E|nr:probable ATP-dependent RNA helicase ddx42 isoform X2 [Neodiprion fabricii]
MERTVRQVILTLALGMGLAFCEPPVSSQYGVPGNFDGQGSHGVGGGHGGAGTVTNSYGAPLNGGGHDAHQDYIDSQPKSYEFGYAVKDAASGNDFGRRETSDGETVRGEYRVQLPDGRTQIVTYTADWRTGFHADVRYEGVASYPDQYNNNNNNNNNYNNNYNNNNGYNDLNANSLDTGYNGAGNNGAYNGNNNYHGSNGNYNTGVGVSGVNNNYANGHNNNYNDNNYDGNSLNGGYNYNAGYSSNANNNFGSKSPVSSYGTPAFH